MSRYQNIIYKIVSQIPKGKVATYSMIASLSGLKSPRPVGNILHKNKSPEKVPCHRVVHKDGSLAKGYGLGGINKQEERLRREGVAIAGGKVNLNKHLWEG